MPLPFPRAGARAVALASVLATLVPAARSASAADPTDLARLRGEIERIKADYDARLKQLEARLAVAEAAAASTPSPAPPSPAAAPPAPAPSAATAGPGSGAGAFNPAMSLILSGTYARLQRDPSTWRLGGFQAGGEIGPGSRSFSLGESELGLAANIDPWFYGAAAISITPENEAAVEEAYVQTSALPAGLTLKFGRFFSGVGYLNEQHAHVWDFVDAPLTHQAFLGGQRGEDGLQLRWLLPTELYAELGAELGRGANFPGSDANRNGAGAWALFGHVGGDIGASQSWRAGLSWLQARPDDRRADVVDAAGNALVDSLTGRSRLWVLDGVWKWAPNGNATHTSLKLQGEYFRSRERGELTVDPDGLAATDAYRSAQSGWYVQGVWQFMPAWRTGLRIDRLDVGRVEAGLNAATLGLPTHDPSRLSWMLDWSPSEFSRVRLQLGRDRTRDGASDNQLYLQYQTSLGAHGAHGY